MREFVTALLASVANDLGLGLGLRSWRGRVFAPALSPDPGFESHDISW